jgi:hypothetical protein
LFFCYVQSGVSLDALTVAEAHEAFAGPAQVAISDHPVDNSAFPNLALPSILERLR